MPTLVWQVPFEHDDKQTHERKRQQVRATINRPGLVVKETDAGSFHAEGSAADCNAAREALKDLDIGQEAGHIA